MQPSVLGPNNFHFGVGCLSGACQVGSVVVRSYAYYIILLLRVRVRHGYGNTRGDRVTGTTGTGTVLLFGTPRHTVYPYHGITGIYGYIKTE
jgi:hypothetical protein